MTESAAKRPVRDGGPGEGPPRRLDVRVGSTPDALAPISIAERSLAAGPRQWGALGLVVGSALAADQLTKQLVSSQLALGDEIELVGPFSIHHVQNSGIAFGLLLECDVRS